MRPAMLCPALLPGLKQFREEFEVERVEAFAYMGDISLALTVYEVYREVTANIGIAGVIAFLRREVDDIGIVANPA